MEEEVEDDAIEDVPNDGGPTGVKTCTDPLSPDMEVTTSSMTSEGKSLSSSSVESSIRCSSLQEVDVGGSEGTFTFRR